MGSSMGCGGSREVESTATMDINQFKNETTHAQKMGIIENETKDEGEGSFTEVLKTIDPKDRDSLILYMIDRVDIYGGLTEDVKKDMFEEFGVSGEQTIELYLEIFGEGGKRGPEQVRKTPDWFAELPSVDKDLITELLQGESGYRSHLIKKLQSSKLCSDYEDAKYFLHYWYYGGGQSTFCPKLAAEISESDEMTESSVTVENAVPKRTAPTMQSYPKCGDYDWGGWGRPNTDEIPLRTSKYLRTGKQKHKKPSDNPILMPAIGLEMFQGQNECPSHIAQVPESQFYNDIHLEDSDNFYFLLNYKVLGMKTCACAFFMYDKSIEEDYPQFAKLWKKFIDGDDDFRNQRFKLFPKIQHGPWILRKTVPNVPTLLGTKVPLQYYRGKNYFEIDVASDQNTLAYTICKMAFPISKQLIVDLCHILQTETEDELPEVIFSGIQLQNIDLSMATIVNNF